MCPLFAGRNFTRSNCGITIHKQLEEIQQCFEVCHCLLIYPLAFFERLYRLGFVGIYVYLSDLKLAHKLRDLDSNQFKDFFLK